MNARLRKAIDDYERASEARDAALKAAVQAGVVLAGAIGDTGRAAVYDPGRGRAYTPDFSALGGVRVYECAAVVTPEELAAESLAVAAHACTDDDPRTPFERAIDGDPKYAIDLTDDLAALDGGDFNPGPVS